MHYDLTAIFICAIMPMCIVFISAYAKMNGENKRSQIIIKAIEANQDVDTDKLLESLRKPKKTPREQLNQRLLRGCIFTLVGLGLLATSIVLAYSGKDFHPDNITIPAIIGGICLPIGISYLIVYCMTRKHVECLTRKEGEK